MGKAGKGITASPTGRKTIILFCHQDKERPGRLVAMAPQAARADPPNITKAKRPAPGLSRSWDNRGLGWRKKTTPTIRRKDKKNQENHWDAAWGTPRAAPTLRTRSSRKERWKASSFIFLVDRKSVEWVKRVEPGG